MLQKTEWKFDTRDLDVCLVNVILEGVKQFKENAENRTKKQQEELSRLIYLMEEYVNWYEDVYKFNGGWKEAVVLEKKNYNEMFRLLKKNLQTFFY